jgi:steroid delta-isomerase-like uncharacterized protein
MSEENKAVVYRYCEEVVNQRRIDLAEEIFAPDFVNHAAVPGQESGLESLKQFFAMIDAGFPDFQVTVEDLFAEGDKVAVRFTFLGTHEGEFMGIAPTGKRVTMPGIDILRVVDGKIVELWGQEDMLGMMQQLGTIPSAGQA